MSTDAVSCALHPAPCRCRPSRPTTPATGLRARVWSRIGSRTGLLPLALALVLCAPCHATDAGAGSQAPGGVGGADTLRAINEARAQAGLPALQADHRLAALAQAHSAHMARQQRLSHDGFEQRRQLAGGGRCVENVAQGLTAPGPLVAAWLANGGHRRNLLAPGLRAAAVASDAGFVTFLACD